MFTELSLGCWSSGHRYIKFCLPQCFSLSVTCTIHAPFIMYCSRLFVVVFQEIHTLNMPMFVGSQSFISLPSFMFVSAVVSEICEEKEKEKKKKKNSEIAI